MGDSCGLSSGCSTDHHAAVRWGVRVGAAARILFWATLVGCGVSALIAASLPLLAVGRAGLAYVRALGLAGDVVNLVALFLLTQPPHEAPRWRVAGASALMSRIMLICAVAAQLLFPFLPQLDESDIARGVVRVAGASAWCAAAFFALTYISSLARQFGAERLARALKLASAAVVAEWAVFHPLQIALASTHAWSAALAVTGLVASVLAGAVVLTYGLVCLYAFALRFPRIVVGRCLVCGYPITSASRCPECGHAHDPTEPQACCTGVPQLSVPDAEGAAGQPAESEQAAGASDEAETPARDND